MERINIMINRIYCHFRAMLINRKFRFHVSGIVREFKRIEIYSFMR